MDQYPEPSGSLAFYLIVLITLTLIIALFEAAEESIEECSKNKIKQLASDENPRAQYLLQILENANRFSSVAKAIIMFLGAMAAVCGTFGFASKLAISMGAFCKPYTFAVSVVLVNLILIFIVFSLGILLPKHLANIYPESTALNIATRLNRISIVVSPIITVATGIVKLLLKILHQKIEEDEEFSEDDVMDMLEVGQESGALKEEGKKMINSIFAFDDKLAYEIMTPRTDVFSIDLNDPPSEYLDELMELRYSRIPVYEDETDNIIGILNIKDFFASAKEVGFENVNIKDILRKPYFVPETKNIDSLFVNLQSSKNQIAVLIDEFGGFSGIVTMEDIIEEVMGDIEDEYDENELTIEQISDNCYMVDGSAAIDDLNEEFNLHLESDNSETIGGLVLDILGEIPEDSENLDKKIELDNLTLTVNSVKERRIEKITLLIHNELQEAEKATNNEVLETEDSNDGKR